MGPKNPIRSTGPSTAPNQCGVQVLNSTASPGSIVRSSLAKDQPQAPVEHVEPVVPVVHWKLLRRLRALGADRRSCRPARPPAGACLVNGHIVMPSNRLGLAEDARVLGRCRAEQLVGADAQRGREGGDVIEREAPLAGLEATQRGEVDVGSRRRPGWRVRPSFGAQLTQPPADALRRSARAIVCLHGNKAWHMS